MDSKYTTAKQKQSGSLGPNVVWHEKGTGSEGSGVAGHKGLDSL